MTATAQDFALTAGDSKLLQFTVTDSDGTAIDLTGARVDWWMSRGTPDRFGKTPVLQKSTSNNSIDVVSPMDGRFDIALAPADTHTFAAGSYYHEAQVRDVLGNVATVTTGTITINRQLITIT